MSGIGFLTGVEVSERLGTDIALADIRSSSNAAAKVSIAAAEGAVLTEESTTFANLTDTTETAISGEITIVVGDSGAVFLSSELDISVTGGAGELGNFPVLTVWKWHNGTSYVRISEEDTPSDPIAAINDAVLLHAGTTSWLVPAGVTSVTAHCIGAGGNGAAASQAGGGGGGEYAEATLSVTPEATVSCQIGAGGSGDDTWFVSTGDVLANAGADASGATGGAGGSGGVGDSTSAGGAGGDVISGAAGAGGGGSAGPGGAGKDGGDGNGGGGGGGGCNGGTSTVGGNAAGTTAGDGGAGPNGTGGGSGGSGSAVPDAGSDGGGGGGGYLSRFPITTPARCDGAEGGMHGIWSNTGPGGGGGGGGQDSDSNGGDGGGYGGGGGGGRATAGAGAPGLIAIETGELETTGRQVTNAGKTNITGTHKFQLFARTTRSSTRTIGFTGFARAQTDDPVT